MTIYIGTAGWSIPRQNTPDFPTEGSALERYATNFAGTEINSSFHRPHRLSTWQRWHDSVPDSFRFSVKFPKEITHVRKLAGCDKQIGDFLAQAHTLGAKLAVILVQLPPKLAFDASLAGAFFEMLAGSARAGIACEPRHASWFTPDADQFLRDFKVARVGADPALCEAAARPGGWPGLQYWRLHGSPVIYRSSYGDRIAQYAAHLRASEHSSQQSWCIFDNTASSAGAGDALRLQSVLATGA